MRLLKQIIILSALFPFVVYGQGPAETLQSLAEKFAAPSDEYRPHVWWHWMGSNFTKEGITKDLEAMKEAGIGGAAIFNLTSSVQHSKYPIGNNPTPEQTYRGEAYWEAMRHTMSEARRLGLQMGLHGAPGYATTGNVWITEERGMQILVRSKTVVADGRNIEQTLAKPELPFYRGHEAQYDSIAETPVRATFYRDVAVIAVPEKPDVAIHEVIDVSSRMNVDGLLKWQAPAGVWNIYRIGHAPTMAYPHPVPDDIIGKALEVDKMSREHNTYYWKHLLEPLKEHIGEFFGNTFTYVWVDSYESGEQNWTEHFRDEFIRIKGYDPVPWYALQQYLADDSGQSAAAALIFRRGFPFNNKVDRKDINIFVRDYADVIKLLFMEGWQTGRDMLHQYGLKFYWEPYYGPTDVSEGTRMADVPVDEFWTHEHQVRHPKVIPDAAAASGKRLVPAEALTGRPLYSKYAEDPAFMKHSTDGAFATGVNLFFLNCWVHQPFDDKYQPGMSFGWWGSHFDRHQTWHRPGKAFFVYLARCQMLLQQGNYRSSNDGVLQRTTPEAELFFVINPAGDRAERTFAFPVRNSVPELWNPYTGTLCRTSRWQVRGDSTYLDLTLEKDGSMFVVFPFRRGNYPLLPEIEILNETVIPVTGAWTVAFRPKLDKPFSRKLPSLIDFGKQQDAALKYFSGTAKYERKIRINAGDLDENRRILLDLGELHDIAELEVNGHNAGVLWSPPYETDITPYLTAGENSLSISITNNWANLLIGDEQRPADFEWGNDRGDEGRALKAFPDWFVKNQPRPSGRKAFTVWYYFRKDSPLYPAGLIGPVRIVKQEIRRTPFLVTCHTAHRTRTSEGIVYPATRVSDTLP
jgi:hypothetical protein